MFESNGLPTPLYSTPTETPRDPNPLKLTPREVQTVRLLADGMSNKLIATALGISEHTAKFHVAQLLKKLEVSTRTEVAVICMRAGY